MNDCRGVGARDLGSSIVKRMKASDYAGLGVPSNKWCGSTRPKGPNPSSILGDGFGCAIG